MIQKTLLSAVLACLAAFAFTVDATAQVQRIDGSGCPGAPFPRVFGAPSLGHHFGLAYPDCGQREVPFLLIGLSRRQVLNPPLTCRVPCLLAVTPVVAELGQAWRTVIPMDRNLIGACVTFQGGCIHRDRRCLTLRGAIRACITR